MARKRHANWRGINCDLVAAAIPPDPTEATAPSADAPKSVTDTGEYVYYQCNRKGCNTIHIAKKGGKK